MNKCYRCGSCCKSMINIIPATEESDLSPDFLEEFANTHTQEELQAYLLRHSEPMGEVCKWLIEPGNGKPCSCRVYEHRPSTCRDYPDTDCNIGKMKMSRTNFFE